MSKTIKVDMLSDAVDEILTLYSENVIDGIKKQAEKSAKELVKQTKATAPVGGRSKHYYQSIRCKKLSENPRQITWVWYVSGSDYRLSHLLEYGHATRNGGRTKAFMFINNAYTQIEEEYLRKVEEIIKNG